MKHYRNKTNFVKLEELKNMAKDVNTEMVKNVDPHTQFMFENGYSKRKMPNRNTHKQAPKTVPDIFKIKTVETG